MKVVKACNDVNNECDGRYKKYLKFVDMSKLCISVCCIPVPIIVFKLVEMFPVTLKREVTAVLAVSPTRELLPSNNLNI